MNPLQWNPRSVVANLMILNVIIFIAQMTSPGLNEQMIQYLGLHAPGSANFYPHQLITYMFLHGGFSHLFFNMFALWMFGRISEYDLGSKRFLTYYMITGIGAGLLNMFVNWIEVINLTEQWAHIDPVGLKNVIDTRMVTIGASGGVYGVLLSFGLMHPNDRIMLLIPPIPMKAKYFVIGFAVIELYLGFAQNGDSVAHFAHLGGMIFGFILLRHWKRKGRIYY